MWTKGKTIDDAVEIGVEEGGLYKLKGHTDSAMAQKACSYSLQSSTNCKQSYDWSTKNSNRT